MPFGRKARTVRTYEFGCLPPTEGEQAAVEQMHRRVRLWNALVALDHRYDEQREALIAPYVTAEDEQERRTQRKAAFKDESVKAQLKALDKAEYEEARPLWLASELYWVNHEEVKIAWQQARAKKKGTTLRFHAWRTENGKVSVRWQTGLPVGEAFSEKGLLLRLAPVPEEAYLNPVRGIRRRLSRSVVKIRVASEERQPVWLTLPCVIHRPLPQDGLIRSASVIRERLGTHYRWKLVLVVETGASEKVSSGPAVGIDLGWRRFPDRLRVAYWHDETGESGEVSISDYWLNGMQQVENLQSIRDQHFNTAKASLSAALKAVASDLPLWLIEATAHLGLWRAPAKLAMLALQWREQRFAGDETIYPALEEWRKRDKHLLEFQANLRDRLLKNRREEYRRFAAWLVKHYGAVAMEDFDLTKVAKVKKGGTGGDLPPAVRHYRQWAAVSTLRLAIENACRREGVLFTKKDAAYTTRRCQFCGNIGDFDAAKVLAPVCPACGMQADQDDRAGANLVSQKEVVLAQP